MAQCRHGIEIGSACEDCGGVAKSIKRANSRNNLAPDAIPTSSALGNVAVTGPDPVHSPALTIDTTSRSATEMLAQLFDDLTRRTGVTLSCPTCAAKLAVCWNWVLFGAARDHETDPRWAYEHVQGEPLPLGVAGSMWLDAAVAEFAKPGKFPTQRSVKLVHVLILSDLLERRGFVLQDGSALRVRVWYRYKDYKAVSYTHMEFVYASGSSCITITKTAGDATETGEVTCYAGSSRLMDASLVFVDVGINLHTLSTQHLRVLAELCSAIPDEPPPKKARRRSGDGKDGKA